jgi:hypothetical protein
MIVTHTFAVQRPVAVDGSFLALVPLLVEQMQARGYAPASVRSSTGLVQDFAKWLDQREIFGLDKVEPRKGRVARFRPDDQLMAFLKAL